MDDPGKEVVDFDFLNDDVAILSFKPKKDFVESNNHSNIGIASHTTTLARLKLHEALKLVETNPKAVLLYYDTDSVIYAYKEEVSDPLESLSGPHLGQLKDEKPLHIILEYVSGGPKNYAMKLQSKKDGSISYEMKVRGKKIL